MLQLEHRLLNHLLHFFQHGETFCQKESMLFLASCKDTRLCEKFQSGTLILVFLARQARTINKSCLNMNKGHSFSCYKHN